ncbi:MAG: type IX secretion system membrane protein PorP/SprF [Flavobacteriales bacterium]|nr:type IX secretion system membrane protein PorP/SprF [Flavobacteriales bacterium]
MKSTLITLTLIATLLLSGSVGAQQLPESNLYNFNKYGINPAYAGYKECLEAYASHLSQWIGVDAAPITDYLYVHNSSGKNTGVGGGIIIDKATYISRVSTKLSYAYKIKLGNKHNLRFGLSAVLGHIRIDPSSAIVEDKTDHVLMHGVQTGFTLGSEFGIFYTLNYFQFGLFIPQIFNSHIKSDFIGVDKFTDAKHIIGYAEYNFVVNQKWKIKPSILYKGVQVKVSQIDINTMVVYNDVINFSIGYRTHIGPLVRLGINIKENILLAYAYEFPAIEIPGYTNGSHEIIIGFNLCNKNTSVSFN